MAGLNKAQIIGNLGADPEVRSLESGNKVANFNIATNEQWKDKTTGEKRERVEWHRIVVWGDGLVGIIEKYVRKGSRIYIEGKLQTRKWQDKDGADKYTTEIVVQGFGGALLLLDGKSEGGGERPPPPSENDAPGGGESASDEIPF